MGLRVLVVTPGSAAASGLVLRAAGRADPAPIGPLRPGSGRVGPAHPATPLGRSLVLIEPAPGAVLLGAAHGIVQALRADRACRAHGLSLPLADVTLGLSLAIGTEEEHDVLTAARSVVLPAPVRPWYQDGLTAYLRHG